MADYGAPNENEWDGYGFKVKYFVPITDCGAATSATMASQRNFYWGSDLGDDSGYANNGIKTRTNNSIASSDILALNYDHTGTTLSRCPLLA
ncbi:outer membrane protein OmpK [Shigella sonnei]